MKEMVKMTALTLAPMPDDQRLCWRYACATFLGGHDRPSGADRDERRQESRQLGDIKTEVE